MSQENVDIVHEAFDREARRDARVLDVYDPGSRQSGITR